MSIEKAKAALSSLLEARAEALESDLTEAPLVPIPAETAEAIRVAAFTLEGLRILKSAYAEERA